MPRWFFSLKTISFTRPCLIVDHAVSISPDTLWGSLLSVPWVFVVFFHEAFVHINVGSSFPVYYFFSILCTSPLFYFFYFKSFPFSTTYKKFCFTLSFYCIESLSVVLIFMFFSVSSKVIFSRFQFFSWAHFSNSPFLQSRVSEIFLVWICTFKISIISLSSFSLFWIFYFVGMSFQVLSRSQGMFFYFFLLLLLVSFASSNFIRIQTLFKVKWVSLKF